MAIFTSVQVCCTIAGVKPFEFLDVAVSPCESGMKLVRRERHS